MAENNSLNGDKARETVKQAAESLKDQVRSKLGDGTTSSISNAMINGLADTGDAALGGADYAADAAMALASCAAGDSYCRTAMNGLAGKNQAVADSVKSLMQSETWSAVAETIKQASEGNQAALEATAGMLAGIILPGKKVVSGATIAEKASGTYQWFDINSEKNQSWTENQQKTWDYWGSAFAAVTGGLVLGRGVWQNVGMAAAGAVFTDGLMWGR